MKTYCIFNRTRKQLSIFCLLIWGLSSCEKIDESFIKTKDNKKEATTDFNVVLKEAQFAAQLFSPVSDSVSSILPIVYQKDTLLYIVNYYNNGWVVLSGDKRTNPILAFDETKGLKIEEHELHPGILTWLDDIAGNIYNLKQFSTDMDTSKDEFWVNCEVKSAQTLNNLTLQRVLISVSTQPLPNFQIGPLVQTSWGQDHPWNTCVPIVSNQRARTGCVAVAISQLLHYSHFKSNKPASFFTQASYVGRINNKYVFSFSNPSTDAFLNMPLAT